MDRDASVDLILVGYRAADTRAALRFCDRTFARRVDRKVVVLNDPGMRPAIVPDARGWLCIDGANTLGEFSGWQEGIDHLDAQGDRRNALLFLNDTVCTHRLYTWMRAAAFKRDLRSAQREARLIGFADWVPGKTMTIDGLPLPSWVSTYCFALSAAALDRLERRVYDAAQIAACVPGGSSEETFFASVSPDLAEHLRRWVFGGGWYGSQRLSAGNASRLVFKSRCIVAEMLLSARCGALGIETFDPFVRHRWLRKLDTFTRRRFERPYEPAAPEADRA